MITMPKTKTEYWRLNLFHRFIHVLVMVSFAGSTVSGMALKFRTATWARVAMQLMGGVPGEAWLHRVCAIIIAFYCLLHFVFIIFYVAKHKTEVFRGPSMLGRPQDVVDLWNNFLYFIGKKPRPKFGRFTYWEKFDYWAVFWGVLIIGLSGLVLWFPELSTRFLPGIAINVAQIMHSDEAVLAVGFIFVVHMFNTHLRPGKFPIDMSIFTGKVSEEELQTDHALEWERMQEDPSLMEKARVE
jgi:cytochrome b subunit of formate dehydrogenase